MRAMGPLLIVPVSGELLEQVANKVSPRQEVMCL